MRMIVLLSLALAVASSRAACAQGPDAPPWQVRGDTLTSRALPNAVVVVDPAYRYVGSQVVNLYGNAEAEQHLFAIADASGVVRRFCWVQLEHFLPTNTMHYDYQVDRAAAVGDVSFMYDVKGWADYRVTTTDAGSDGHAMAELLARHHLAFPARAARVRMFHFPDSTRRREIMIIYGEALPDDSPVPVAATGVALDAVDPASARLLLSHAVAAVAIRAR